jgi:hypothetical protein
MKTNFTRIFNIGLTFLSISTLSAQYFPTNGLVEYFSFNTTLVGSLGTELEAETSQFSTGYLGDVDGAYSVNSFNTTLTSASQIDGYPMINNDFTICFWLKLNSNTTASLFNYTGYAGAILNENIYSTALTYENNMLVLTKVEAGEFTSTSINYAFNTEWHHILIRHVGSNNANMIYIDGVFTGNPTFSFNTVQNSTSTFKIGQSPGGTHFGNFEIDEFLIYDRILNTDEIAEIVNQSASLSIKDVDQVIVYPNPAKTNIALNNLTIGSALQIIDITGKTVLETIVSSSEMTIDLNMVNNGVYFVQMMNNSEITASKKLVVNK